MRYIVCLLLVVTIFNSFATVVEKENYVVYLPKNYDQAKSYPLILFCDPHGSGAYPISLYKELADSFNYILVGSNFSKNGVDIIQCENVLKNTIEEMFLNYKIIKEHVSIAGFSGGSYIAYHLARFTPYFKNVIISGTPIRPIPLAPYPNILCLAGKEDMNYTDLVALDKNLDAINYTGKHFTIEYNGKHEWPNAASFYDAFIFMNAMYCYACKINRHEQEFLRINQEKKYTDEYEKMMSYKKVIFMLDSTGGIDDIKKYYQSNLNNTDYIKIKNKNNEFISKESAQKKFYLDQFKVAYDSNYWKAEVLKLNNKENLSIDEQAMHQRLLSFLSLLGYSYTNKVLKNNQLEIAPMLLNFYEIVDPKNTDMFYFKAVYAIMKNNRIGALEALQTAFKLGYKDADKLMKDDNFSILKNDADFMMLISKMQEK